MDTGKVLGSRKTQEKVDKASDQTINKTYAGYKQHELIEKGEKDWKSFRQHVVNLYSTGISRVAKIRDVKKLQQDIENDSIIRDQMANLGYFLVCSFGNFLGPVLVAAHTVKNLDLGDKRENQSYESD